MTGRDMSNEQENGKYQTNDADALVDEIFSGRITVEDAIEQIRARLLDLSERNGLLKYRHPKGRSVQIAGAPNINLVFDRLYVDGRAIRFEYVPEPSPGTYEGKRPEAKLYAAQIGLSTSFEFASNPVDLNGHGPDGIQTLLYPADLERQLRKIAGEAKTAVEEVGTNMLFLIFGFLEFYNSEDSDRPMLAPLISLPVSLVRDKIDQGTGTYRYTVQYNGEDLAQNRTLQEKLRRDFMLSIPEFKEDDKPESYFGRVERAVNNKRRWKVRRQITLGMLSFGKLAIWADLDTKKNPGLTEHALIKSVFSGGTGGDGGGFHAEDYHIDERPEAAQPLIYEADSSQHSAIIDVLAGKNLVINGPPGTGKSQTITNIIATALSQGKTVLFVSEKLAALEVVRRNLDRADLGHFCLELHSHKTQKKKLLEDIKARIDKQFPPVVQFQAKLATLQRQKTELARYAELMGSCVGNAMELTVNEVFWAAERRRQEFGDLSATVAEIGLPAASQWTHDDIESRRSRLAGLAQLYDAIGRFDSGHPWWGFSPNPLTPFDAGEIDRTIHRALKHAQSANSAAEEAVAFFGLEGQHDTATASKIRAMLRLIPPVPDGAEPSLLARMFEPEFDLKGRQSSRLLSEVATGVNKSKGLFESASRVLVDGERISPELLENARKRAAERRLSSTLLAADMRDALTTVVRLEKARDGFAAAAHLSGAPYGPADKAGAFLTNCGKFSASGLAPFPIRSIATRATAVLETAKRLSDAVSRVGAIAERYGLPFDSTPDAVARLADPNGLPGLAKAVRLDEQTLVQARRLAAFSMADKSVAEIGRMKSRLASEVSACTDALNRCRQVAERIGIAFDSTEGSVLEIVTLARIAKAVPEDLLEYRRVTFGRARTAELITKVRSSLAAERADRASLDAIFYLDNLPTPAEVKSAVAVLRRKDGFFAFFDGEWRKARRLHASLSKEKRKVSSRRRAQELTALDAWIETRESFVSDPELKECFGGLFRGLETNLDKIVRLDVWYSASRKALLECPGLIDKLDLTAIPSKTISELAAKADAIRTDAQKLAGVEASIQCILGVRIAGFREAKTTGGWDAMLSRLGLAVKRFADVANFFSCQADTNLSPKRALRLMEARAELDASPDLALLMRGEMSLREAGGEELGCLADLAGGRWSEAIVAVSEQASLAAEMASQALAFTGEDSPLSIAKAFAAAKQELDVAWSLVAPLPVWNRFVSWPALIEGVGDDTAAAKTILESLAPFARSGVSVEKVFAASTEVADAHAILQRLADSDDVRRLLGDVFKGADTDLDALSQTHGWGEAICALDLPTAIRRRLLSEEAREAFDTARQLYVAMDDGCRAAKESVESLASYGSFFWDEWQGPVRADSGRDLPSEMKLRLEDAAGVPESIIPWSKYLSLKQQAQQEGLADFVSALESERMPSAALAAAFELAVYRSIGDSIYQKFPELSRFNGSTHEKRRSDFRALDAEIMALAGKNFANEIEGRTHVPAGQKGITSGEFTERHLLEREINKQRKHIPIRQLVKRAGNALQALKPCFMMGPLSVAQYLEQGALKFDLVVMDEASQLRPEEALGAIARGSQLVVVGDPKQLPPTNFFRMLDSGDDEDEDEIPAAISGMESILDICQQLFTPVRSLRWHYRSQHESLIAFSNHHFYKNLIVFPSPYAKNPGLGVKYRYVKGGFYKDRQNVPEAWRLVDAVLEHTIKRPDESLGVVTLNQTQRDLIEELLHSKIKTFVEGADFMDRWEAKGWPFFVKNLENVQGDERDVIFISTTFGKAPGTDKIRQNFGPNGRADGWRRLNVLFTRSKRRIELFTSMTPEDIVVDERTPLGTKALRDYLDFAKRGVLVTTDERQREPDSDFEVSVANVVMNMGYEVKPQLGVAGFFIDMAVRNPERPGEFLAGIECDGATYHSGFSVRDRDRIRQEILESLGWKGRIHRIWSTDWFSDPRKETERLRNFLEERRRLSAAEEPSDGDEEEDYGVRSEDVEETAQIIEEPVEAVSFSLGNEDLFVEVGDRVTYCYVDDPSDRHSILIVDSSSNPEMDITNEKTPLAQALLDHSPGEVVQLEAPDQKNRRLRILKVQHQGELLA